MIRQGRAGARRCRLRRGRRTWFDPGGEAGENSDGIERHSRDRHRADARRRSGGKAADRRAGRGRAGDDRLLHHRRPRRPRRRGPRRARRGLRVLRPAAGGEDAGAQAQHRRDQGLRPAGQPEAGGHARQRQPARFAGSLRHGRFRPAGRALLHRGSRQGFLLAQSVAANARPGCGRPARPITGRSAVSATS